MLGRQRLHRAASSHRASWPATPSSSRLAAMSLSMPACCPAMSSMALSASTGPITHQRRSCQCIAHRLLLSAFSAASVLLPHTYQMAGDTFHRLLGFRALAQLCLCDATPGGGGRGGGGWEGPRNLLALPNTNVIRGVPAITLVLLKGLIIYVEAIAAGAWGPDFNSKLLVRAISRVLLQQHVVCCQNIAIVLFTYPKVPQSF